MARVVSLSLVARRFTGWFRLSPLKKLFWAVRKGVGFTVGYGLAMAAVLWYNAPGSIEAVAEGASPFSLVGPVLELGLLSVVVAVAVAFAVLVPTVYQAGGGQENGLRFRL